jgi:hypothetical protein
MTAAANWTPPADRLDNAVELLFEVIVGAPFLGWRWNNEKRRADMSHSARRLFNPAPLCPQRSDKGGNDVAYYSTQPPTVYRAAPSRRQRLLL